MTDEARAVAKQLRERVARRLPIDGLAVANLLDRLTRQLAEAGAIQADWQYVLQIYENRIEELRKELAEARADLRGPKMYDLPDMRPSINAIVEQLRAENANLTSQLAEARAELISAFANGRASRNAEIDRLTRQLAEARGVLNAIADDCCNGDDK